MWVSLGCEGVECGDIPIQSSSNRTVPRVTILSREVGGRATFSCQSGYGIRGPSETTCLQTGEWAQPFPSCFGLNATQTNERSNPNKNPFHITEVQCDNPGSPLNGYAQGSAPYRAGDVIQFNCNPEFMVCAPTKIFLFRSSIEIVRQLFLISDARPANHRLSGQWTMVGYRAEM